MTKAAYRLERQLCTYIISSGAQKISLQQQKELHNQRCLGAVFGQIGRRALFACVAHVVVVVEIRKVVRFGVRNSCKQKQKAHISAVLETGLFFRIKKQLIFNGKPGQVQDRIEFGISHVFECKCKINQR
jgi:hypothetical protein